VGVCCLEQRTGSCSRRASPPLSPNSSKASEENEKGATELVELRPQLQRALASNHSHVHSIHALRRKGAWCLGGQMKLSLSSCQIEV
jgi:hypothetical protein